MKGQTNRQIIEKRIRLFNICNDKFSKLVIGDLCPCIWTEEISCLCIRLNWAAQIVVFQMLQNEGLGES